MPTIRINATGAYGLSHLSIDGADFPEHLPGGLTGRAEASLELKLADIDAVGYLIECVVDHTYLGLAESYGCAIGIDFQYFHCCSWRRESLK
ncbi:MAG TPA: hypothetical protein VN817_03385 [Solirubrobacteraceae bacterium]|nr:hypothetical protein [Solirubrobacteraceae bacterium]